MQKWILFSLFGLALFAHINGDETQAVKQRAESFVSAFNKKDIKSIGEHWDREAALTDQRTGKQFKGREAIVEKFKQYFHDNEKKGLNVDLKAVIDSVKIPEDNKAILKGKSTLFVAGKDTFETHFRVVFVKRNGSWYISEVHEVQWMPLSKV